MATTQTHADWLADGVPRANAARWLERLRLSFPDAELERRFRDEQYDVYLPVIRLSLLLGALLYGLFGVADLWVLPESKEFAWTVRYAVVCPFILATLACSGTPFFRRHIQSLLAGVILIASAGLLAILAVGEPPGNHLYYAGFVIIVIYAYHFVRLRFASAFAISWVIFAGYEFQAIVVNPIPAEILVSNSFFLVTTNLVGMITGFAQEYLIRRDFMTNQLLREGERRLTSIAANVPGSVFRLVQRADGGTVILYMSEGLRSVFGRDPRLLAQHPNRWVDWVHPDDVAGWREVVRRAMQAGAPFSHEMRFVGEDGQVRWMRTSARPHPTPRGEIVWDGVNLDISDLKAREQELMQAQKMEAVGQLTGGVAHDFNNLLTIVSGNLHLVAEDVRDPELAEMIASARGAAARGQELVRRLLAFSRRQALAPRALDLARLIGGMSGLLRRTLGEAVAVRTVVEEGLWPALCDANQLDNAILNLALNARDAMPNGGTLTIEARNATLDSGYADRQAEFAPGDYVVLAVGDTGCGMTPETIARAFEPFFTTKGPGAGTGLGLSMVYGFARQSRGHVKIYSELGQGTTIRLYLPRAPGDAAGNGEAESVVAVPGDGERILLVEDDPEVRRLANRMLSDLRYRVRAAADGAEALALLRAGEPVDLLLTDIVMPGGIGGPALAEAARRLRPELRLLFCTGYTENSPQLEQFLRAGAPLLSKPYTLAELAGKVRLALSGGSSG